MNSGSFFHLDLEASKVVNGVTFYEYTDLPDISGEKDIVRYPVRLSISPDNVTFFIHYYYGGNKDGKDYLPYHSEEVILDLPYNSSDKEALSAGIKRVYNTVFPLSDYLRYLVTERYININTNNAYSRLQSSQVNKDTFSTLSIWGLVKVHEDGKMHYQLEDTKSKQVTGFLRKLLLDFMFDLMHSDVFESSKYYPQMREGLMSDFFFSSIVKKCEYYYNRRLIRNRFSGVNLDSDEIKYLLRYRRYKHILSIVKKNRILGRILSRVQNRIETKEKAHLETNSTLELIKKLYVGKLDDSESAWIDAIMNPLAEQHFSFSPEWFEDKEPRKKKNRFSVAESWFVNPEEEMARVVFPLAKEEEISPFKAFLSEIKKLFSKKSDKPDTIHYLNSYELSELIGTENQASVLERNTKISKWFYRRFDFVDAFRLHLFQHWNHIFAFFLLVFGVVAMIPGFWECPRNFALFPFAAAIGFLLTSLIFARLIRIQTVDKIDSLLVRTRRRREGWRGVRLFALFLAFWAFLYCYQTAIWWHVLVKGLAFLAIAIPVLYFIRPRVHIVDNIHLFLPRLIASITAAWAMVVLGNEPIQEYLSWPICVILASIVFSFILYESNKSLPTITTIDKIWRALELMLISYSISLIIGIFGMDILSNSLSQEAVQNGWRICTWCFLDNCAPLTITIYPKLLIPFSFLAMFIGVFIQMIFEEKNITEM